MRNAVWLDFGLEDPVLGTRRIIKGEGYGTLMGVLFREGAKPEDILHFMFGAALDHTLFGCDVLMETLKLIHCNEAILFRLTERHGWTAVHYQDILTESPKRTEVKWAQWLYNTKFEEETPPATDVAVSDAPPEEGPGKQILRGLKRWAFGRE